MLWLTMYQISPQAAMLISENIGGANPRTIMREAATIDAENRVKTGSSIIDRSKEESVKLLCNDMRDKYSALKEGPIVLSYSIDVTNNTFGLFIYEKSGKIVGGDYLNHALDVPMGDDAATKLQDIIDSSYDKNSGKKKAYEIKLATVVYPKIPRGHSPML